MDIKRIPILLFTSIFLFINGLSYAFAAGEEIPAPVGDIYVQDFANVLSPSEEQQLIGLGKAVENKTGAQVAVLTINTTGEKEMTEYANEAFRAYGIGSKERNDGALIVLAVKDRNIRIEVGYGLEGILPDGKIGRILDNHAIPNLTKGLPNAAIFSTYQALANEITGALAQTDESSQQPDRQQSEGQRIPSWLLVVLIVIFVIVDFTFFGGTLTFLLLSILSRGGGRGGGGGPRGGGGGSSGGGGAGRSW